MERVAMPVPPSEPEPVVTWNEPQTPSTATRVTVVDLDIPMGSMVSLLVKVAVAAIPALALLGVIGFVLTVLLVAFGASTR